MACDSSVVRIDTRKCTSCQACVPACPFGAVAMDGDYPRIGDACTICGACVEVCPAGAIIAPERTEEPAAAATSDIWVFAEQRGGKIASVAYELLGAARRLASSGGTVGCVLLGNGLDNECQSLIESGADTVYVVNSPELADFRDEPYSQVLAEMIGEYKPAVVLFGATSTGRSLAPRLAGVLRTGLTADCTGLEMSPDGVLLQTRPAFGGNIMATIKCPVRRPQMATVRPRVMKRLAPDSTRKGDVIHYTPRAQLSARTRVLEFIEDAGNVVNLEDADIIVAGGRGLGDPKNFDLLRELAATMNAALGASRAAVDAGWIPYIHQIGQTGKTVGPKVYFAIGISGAVQHIAGISSSDIIVAINKDPDAPIFKIATYGIVGDLFEIVPALIKELKARQQD